MNLFRSIAAVFAVVLLQGATLAQEQLTEVERLRWELAATREQLAACNGAWIKADLAQLKAAVEAAHPGHTLDLKTGTLVRKPQAETEKKP